ncbi:DUF4097 domain-containing protein [Lactobacillus salsicarnum]|nr:DUF4097 domain-containing protein [Companilactobacillus mishanensis]
MIMRKYLVTGLYLLIIGVVLAVGGHMMGASKTVVWHHGFQVSKSVDTTKSVGKFSKIEADTEISNIKVKSGDKFQVQVVGDQFSKAEYKIKDDTLVVSEKYLDSGHVGVSSDHKIVVTIPKGTQLENVDLTMGDSNARLVHIDTKNLKVHSNDDDIGLLALNSVKVTDSAEVNLNHARLWINKSHLNNLKMLTDSSTNINIIKSTISNSKLDLHQGYLDIEDSVLENNTISMSQGRVELEESQIHGINGFDLEQGQFEAEKVNTDGLDLSTKNGEIEYLDSKKNERSFQNNPDAGNLLRVSSTQGKIVIK